MINVRRILALMFSLAFIPLLVGMMAISVFAQDEEKNEEKGAAPAAAGNYQEDAPNESFKGKFRDIKSIVTQSSGRFGNQAEQKQVEDYFENYEFKLWTQQKHAVELAKWRKDFGKLQKQAKPGQIHDRLNDLAFDVLGKKLKTKKYSPTFRLNAIVAIGDLNAVEGSTPTPLPKTLPFLLETLADEKELDAIRINAVNGIRRHVVAGMKDPETSKLVPDVSKAMLKLASSEDSALGKSWMRTQAVEILGLMGSPGENDQVVLLLQSIIENTKLPAKLRCDAADALGQLNLAGASANLKADALIASLGLLVKDGCREELDAAEEKGANVSIRTIKTFADALLSGLGDANKGLGIASAKNASAKTIDAQKKAIRELIGKLDKEDATDEDIRDAVEAAIGKI
jgi:uncharacterized protein (UPF0147 family)